MCECKGTPVLTLDMGELMCESLNSQNIDMYRYMYAYSRMYMHIYVYMNTYIYIDIYIDICSQTSQP